MKAWLFLAAAIWSATAAHAKTPEIDAVGFDQHLNEPAPLSIDLRDDSGARVKLGDYFKRPVLLQLGYFECPNLCSTTLNSLVASLRKIEFDAGRQFDVVVVSIDPTETPALAAAKKAAYVREYQRPNTASGWHFLTADEAAIRRLAQAVGFRYVYDPELRQYAHPAGIVVLTPAGKISRYFFGVEFPPQDLRLALVEAGSGKIGVVIDRLLLLCSGFDPATGKYSQTVIKLTRVVGIATLLALIGGIAWLARRKGQARQ